MNNANEFLIYVSENTDRLKRNLKKNITFQSDLFDDIFSESIIKCYDSIVKNDLIVDDFQNYFFISSKWNFINAQNKDRKYKACRVDIDDKRNYQEPAFNEDDEDEITPVTRLAELKDIVTDYFGQKRSDLFFTYYSDKIENKIDIHKLIETTGYTEEIIRQEISRIKRFLIDRTEDKYIKSEPLF